MNGRTTSSTGQVMTRPGLCEFRAAHVSTAVVRADIHRNNEGQIASATARYRAGSVPRLESST